MSLAVRGDRVLIAPINQRERTTTSGVLTIEHDTPDVIGRIVSAGAEVDEVGIDDVVIFPPRAGQRVEFQGERYLMLRSDELLGVWESA